MRREKICSHYAKLRDGMQWRNKEFRFLKGKSSTTKQHASAHNKAANFLTLFGTHSHMNTCSTYKYVDN